MQAAKKTQKISPLSFHHGVAISWRISTLLQTVTNKKMLSSAQSELSQLEKDFGNEFEKYLLRALVQSLEQKETKQSQKDTNKGDTFRQNLLVSELGKVSKKNSFMPYILEIQEEFFKGRPREFIAEMTKKLKLSYLLQILVALSLSQSLDRTVSQEAMEDLKQILIQYHQYNHPEPLPEYAAHELVHLLSTEPYFVILYHLPYCQNDDYAIGPILQYIVDTNKIKETSIPAVRLPIEEDLSRVNLSNDLNLMQDLDFLLKTPQILEPWDVMKDLGQFSTYQFNNLQMALADFQSIKEHKMTLFLLHLSCNNEGYDDQNTRTTVATFEAQKKNDMTLLNRDQGDKRTQVNWSDDTIARAFREFYSYLNWSLVFQGLIDVEDDFDITPKTFTTFINLFSKCKPQNLNISWSVLLEHNWANPSLQIKFIQASTQLYIDKKLKAFDFSKGNRRQEIIGSLSYIKEKCTPEYINIWLNVDFVERLIELSDSQHYKTILKMFNDPRNKIPEYLVLVISLCQCKRGSALIDELLSVLMPQFIGNHANSITVLQNLWKNNQALTIRCICELCNHDQRIMNLSRVLDITQEIKDSFMTIVNCADYKFAVNLGILAGKRDFLHFDVWIQSRIKDIGTPFIIPLVNYIYTHIINPLKKDDNNLPTDEDKTNVLEKSHLNKEKIILINEHLHENNIKDNPKIDKRTFQIVESMIEDLMFLFPQTKGSVNSVDIDDEANRYFSSVFSADPEHVDEKIEELIETMKRFKESEVKRDQELYACMLHSMFDEYRFFHKYPYKYLEMISKLFGAIIKNKLIDSVLLEIALKFVFEAFRREGKRQKFGIITIKQFFDILPEYESFFKDIYQIRHQLEQSDPDMMRKIEDLWNKTQAEKKAAEVDKQQQQTPVKEQPVKQDEEKKPSPQPEAAQPKVFVPKSKRVNEAPSFTPNQLSNQFVAYSSAPAEENKSSFSQHSAPFKPNQIGEIRRTTSTTPVNVLPPQQIYAPMSTFGNTYKPRQGMPAPYKLYVQFKQEIQEKIQNADKEGKAIKLEDLLENPDITKNGPTSEIRTQIAGMLNMISRDQVKEKSEEIQGKLGSSMDNEKWYVQFILGKRVITLQINLFPIFHELIRLYSKSSVGTALILSNELYKKCLLINEDQMNKVNGKYNQQSSSGVIKTYLVNLGTFIGGLTLAINRPLLQKQLDLKQILYEGFEQDRFRYAIIFVCRIVKEAQRSVVFKAKNPFIHSILVFLKELQSIVGNIHKDLELEISSVFKAFEINFFDIGQSTHISGSFPSLRNKEEQEYFKKKCKPIPNQQIPPPQVTASPSPQPGPSFTPTNQPIRSITPTMSIPQVTSQEPSSPERPSYSKQQMDQIFAEIIITDSMQIQGVNEKSIRRLIGEVVEQSIADILPPVVDRSVTIALITTRELVLKDFAYDKDSRKVLRASELIVQNLAGSLALVTCREPLKMSLQNKIKQHYIDQMQQSLMPVIQESSINDFAANASKENLELGCTFIKKAVIEKALAKVHDDSKIKVAIFERDQIARKGDSNFKDPNMIGILNELPKQLQPYESGLTDEQFRVYEDFQKIGKTEGAQTAPSVSLTDMFKTVENAPKFTNDVVHLIKTRIEQTVIANDQLEKDQLFDQCSNWLDNIMYMIANSESEKLQHFIDLYKTTTHNLAQFGIYKRMTSKFLQNLDRFVRNKQQMTATVLQLELISIAEYDRLMCSYVQECAQQNNEPRLKEVSDILLHLLVHSRVINTNQLPNLLRLINSLMQTQGGQRIFSSIFNQIGFTPAAIQISQQDEQIFKQKFIDWVTLSNMRSSNEQERQINTYFQELNTMLNNNQQMQKVFMAVTIRTGIQKCTLTEKGEKRPIDRLEYGWIDSIMKLVVVLLKTMQLNKLEFMHSIFESLAQSLDSDHQVQKIEFNQKPYYRMLMNIMKTVHHSECFNQKTHMNVLLSLAELFCRIQPGNYPGFSFAWLELVSHNQFMPFMLNTSIGNKDNNWYQKQCIMKDIVIHMFNFLKNHSIEGEKMPEHIFQFYKAVLRIALVITHDYPSFFANFHFNFVNSLPSQCIQLKNIVLSSCPSGFDQPSPMARNLKVDLLETMKDPPQILSNFENYLSIMNLKEDLEAYFRARKSNNPNHGKLLQQVCDKLGQCEETIQTAPPQVQPNPFVANAFVIFVIMRFPNVVDGQSQSVTKEVMEFFKEVLENVPDLVRLALINSIVNELRYSNQHTFIFSCILLYIFQENNEVLQEIIAKVLFERLQAQKPHPWGLVITFRELLQNPKYSFMQKRFIVDNQRDIDLMFEGKLKNYKMFVTRPNQNQQRNGQ